MEKSGLVSVFPQAHVKSAQKNPFCSLPQSPPPPREGATPWGGVAPPQERGAVGWGHHPHRWGGVDLPASPIIGAARTGPQRSQCRTARSGNPNCHGPVPPPKGWFCLLLGPPLSPLRGGSALTGRTPPLLHLLCHPAYMPRSLGNRSRRPPGGCPQGQTGALAPAAATKVLQRNKWKRMRFAGQRCDLSSTRRLRHYGA